MNNHRLALVLVLLSGGCARTVSIDLTLVEPCDQKDQALNGVSSYVLTSKGGEGKTDPVAFSVDDGAKPLPVTLGDVIVTVEAFADDVSKEGAASSNPQAVGRTMPLEIAAATPDLQAMVLIGKTQTFGKTTAADGKCTKMTKGAEVEGRHGHTATFVPKLNQVLIVGGAVWVTNDTGAQEERFLDSAELWDPATGEYTKLEGINSRAYHAATAMPDGRVLITGGFGKVGGKTTVLKTMLLFDPETKAFQTLLLKQARAHHTSTFMPGINLIAIVGGCVGEDDTDGCTPTSAGAGPDGDSTALNISIETFDVKKGTATTAITNGLLAGRAFHQATVIGEGAAQVLVVTGGTNATAPICDIEFFRLEGTGLVRVESDSTAPFPPGKCPVQHSAVSLDATNVMVIGGRTAAPGGAPSGTGSNEIYLVSALGARQDVVATTLIGRYDATAARMNDGSVVLLGGVIADATPVAERIAQQGSAANYQSAPLAGLDAARAGAALAVLPTNQLFYSGGYSTEDPKTTSASATLFFGR